MDIAITRMSSKGQIVIPSEMREDIREGEKFVVIRADKQLILKSVEDFGKNIQEDLEFAKRTEEAWKKYERGEFESKTVDEFLDIIEKC
ncbi:MAG: AbrB/MazE/SpoVT family DNA-binding domain-containing protein [Candidatus Woesearchaeota archaeon]